MSQTKEKNAISPTRAEDYPEWFQEVIKAADMAENSPVRGCMVIKPWGYGIWENIQKELDQRIKDTGHENAYFPLFVPVSFLEKEAAHIEGFAKECAVVTHHRLEAKDGKLIPAAPLEEALIIRPTSETIIGDAFSRWVESWRDLPLLINQWANIVRWEMRPRIFLRTTEFLWQEGHTAHASKEEAEQETLKMLEVYRSFLQDCLAIPAVAGEKSPGERFPGAVATYTVEAMMQDGKALQAGTSHFLGQNFSKAFNISFSNQAGQREHAYTTSWGVTTRLIGALIMCHSDDDGLKLPPRIATKQVVIVPVVPKEELQEEVYAYADAIAASLSKATAFGQPIKAFVDKRDKRGGEKNWEWIKKGVPVRIEVGPKDKENGVAIVARRDRGHREKISIAKDVLIAEIPKLLEEIQNDLLIAATSFRDSHIHDVASFAELSDFFADGKKIGFARGKWCGDIESEKQLEELKITIRCIPFAQRGGEGPCVLTGKPATSDALFARAY
jgi:prolyl-tRNA synthetase